LAFFDQYLALFQKQYKMWKDSASVTVTVLQWKMYRNLHAIYLMVLFPMTFNNS